MYLDVKVRLSNKFWARPDGHLRNGDASSTSVQTVDASGFVDLFHGINVRFTPVISVYVHLFSF